MSTAQQYLGSKLSLISKACIRYEGILHSIDPVSATLTLANVKMFGTETRKVDNPVAPSSKVYGFISFKGTDLKDIYMCDDNAKKTPSHDEIPDPAIIEHSEAVASASTLSSHSSNTPSNFVHGGAQAPDFSAPPAPKFSGPPPPFGTNNAAFYAALAAAAQSGAPPPGFGVAQNAPASYGSGLMNYNALSANMNVPHNNNVNHNANVSGYHRKSSPTVDQGTQMTPMNKNYNKAPGQPPRPGMAHGPIGSHRSNNGNVQPHGNIGQKHYPSSSASTSYHNSTNSNNLSYARASTAANTNGSANMTGNYAAGRKPVHQYPYQAQNQHYNNNGPSMSRQTTQGHLNGGLGGNIKVEGGDSGYQNQTHRANNMGLGNYHQHTNYHNHNVNMNNAVRHGGQQPQNNLAQSLKEEFDFDAANAQFNKDDLSKEFEAKLKLVLTSDGAGDESKKADLLAAGSDHHTLEDVENLEASKDGVKTDNISGEKDGPMCYDASRSFFDNISCQTNMDTKRKLLNKLSAEINKEKQEKEGGKDENKNGTKDVSNKARYFGTALGGPNRSRGHESAGGNYYPNNNETFGYSRPFYNNNQGGGNYRSGYNPNYYNGYNNYNNYNSNRGGRMNYGGGSATGGYQSYRTTQQYRNYGYNNSNSSNRSAGNSGTKIEGNESQQPIKVGGAN